MANSYYTSHAVARLVSVSPSTVLSWIDKGLLPAHRTPGGHRRVEPGALVRFLREHGMPIPRDLATVSRLLVIDDDTAFLRTVSRVLRRRLPELEVDTADGAVDGLLKIGIKRPDAVLLDAFMPGMEGPELCRRLHSSPETAHIVVVAITGHPSQKLEEEFRQAGAVAFLTKPFDPNRLIDALGLRRESLAAEI